MDDMANLNRATKPLSDRIRMMIGRVLVRLVDDTKKAQSLQIELLDQESQEGVERFQNYGFTSNPHPGAEGLGIAVGGLRSHMVVIAVEDRRYRMKALETGEVALYDDLGNFIKLGRNKIEITAVTEAHVTAPDVTIDAEADCTITAGSCTINSDDINLGASGGPAVARIGDDVDLVNGKILTGSDKVAAA
ncbi:phage baseplate assembly protein V [Sphingorhabdus sp. 109]|uniref:phage baseplate assembly protein V n=1 Tax=Sphingorhabdus sp. 109 TaxID=2653173 RepID=UPI0012EF93DE|nr:phage baseplate assembly protein V [Sphingorhabdus sp. 109]VWX62608.1 conserved hypothetical protein [Sphingorhabdus sp. 109]